MTEQLMKLPDGNYVLPSLVESICARPAWTAGSTLGPPCVVIETKYQYTIPCSSLEEDFLNHCGPMIVGALLLWLWANSKGLL